MKFPEIPTDSLYKFMATSGIVIIIASFVPLFYQHKLCIQYIQLAGEKHKLDYENESLRKDIEKFLNVELSDIRQKAIKLKENIQSRVNKSWFKTLTRKEFNRFTDEAENLKVELLEVAIETEEFANERKRIDNLTIQIAIKELELKYIKGIIRTGLGLFHYGVLSGFVLTVLGFSLWYKNLQYPLDKTIKNKSKNLQDNK